MKNKNPIKKILVGLAICLSTFFYCTIPQADPNQEAQLLPPQSIKAELQDDHVLVCWDGVSNADAYHIYKQYGQSAFGYLIEVEANTEQNTFKDTDIPKDQTVHYAVSSVSRAIVSPLSGPSNGVSRYILNIRPSRCAYKDKIDIKWDKYDTAQSYRVYRYETKNDMPLLIGDAITNNMFEDETCSTDIPYFYSVTWMENGVEKGQGVNPEYGIRSSETDYYEPNDTPNNLDTQPESSVFNGSQKPLIYSFGTQSGEVFSDSDYYKYVGTPKLVTVTLVLTDSPGSFNNNELRFKFYYNGKEYPEQAINKGLNTFIFDNFGSVTGTQTLYYKVYPMIGNSRNVIGTYTLNMKTGL